MGEDMKIHIDERIRMWTTKKWLREKLEINATYIYSVVHIMLFYHKAVCAGQTIHLQ